MAAVNCKCTIVLALYIAFFIQTSLAESLRFRPRYIEPEQDWKYVDVREGAHMFYWLYYTTNTAGYLDTPLVLWLQMRQNLLVPGNALSLYHFLVQLNTFDDIVGGPGGSGTGFGNFEEIGPLDVNLKPRNTTWLQSASLLFVDNPVGTGYSYVDNVSDFTHNVQEIADDMLVLLKAFFMTNSPKFQTVPFYIFSESYGGKMTAAISQQLYQTIQKGDIKCNFKGLAMGDSWISPVDSTLTWAPYLYVNSLVDESGYDAINETAQKVKSAIQLEKWSDATDLWGSTQTTVVEETNGVNFYNILKWGQEETSSLFADINDVKILRMLGKLHQDDLSDLMNGKIRQQLGIIPDKVKWGGQSDQVFATQAGDFMKPVIDIVDTLITTTDLKVVVYSGQLDLIVDTIGTEHWVDTLSIADRYQEAKRKVILHPITKYPSGFVKTFDNFSFYWILDAGHMIPSDNSETALKMLNMIINQQ